MNRAIQVILTILVSLAGLNRGSTFAQAGEGILMAEQVSGPEVKVHVRGDTLRAGQFSARDAKAQTGFERWLTEKPRGLYNNTSFAIVSGRGNLFSGGQTAFGYKFNPHLGLGGGIGIERFTNLPTYSYYTANFTLMPVFAELRYTILKTRVSPVIALQGGYKFLINTPSSQADEWTVWELEPYVWSYYYSADTYLNGGFFGAIEIGVNAKICKRFGLFASLDYSVWSVSGGNYTWRYQHISVDPPREKITAFFYTRDVIAYQHIFLFRLGFSF